MIPNVDLMLGHRLRRWPKIKSALGERHVFVGKIMNPFSVYHDYNRFYFSQLA